MRFDPQTISVRDTLNRPYSIEALVALQDDGTPVGLAVHPVYRLVGPGETSPRSGGEYTLTHVASGVRLLRENVVCDTAAYSWLELIAPLTDWRQPRAVLRTDETLRLQVRLARMRAQFWDEDDERALFTAGGSEAASSSTPSATFTLESLTAFIECVTDAMESAEFTEEAQPTLDTLLLVHAQLARTERPSAAVVS